MNHTEAIVCLGQLHARRGRPKRREEVNPRIPFFEIRKNAVSGGYEVEGFAYERHPNAERMAVWLSYLTRGVLPHVRSETNVCGFYNIELHDSYTYLLDGRHERRRDTDYRDVLCWTKFKDDAGPIVVPDPYMICNWWGQLGGIQDKCGWDQKNNDVLFYGTTTGAYDPATNERLRVCEWALDKEWARCHITQVAQMTVGDIVRAYGQDKWGRMYQTARVTPQQQMASKFQLMVPGNTCRFDVWPFKTNSLVLKMAERDMLWYHPLMKNGREFVEVGLDNIEKTRGFMVANPNEAKRIVTNARVLAHDLFETPKWHQLYTATLFETMGDYRQ